MKRNNKISMVMILLAITMILVASSLTPETQEKGDNKGSLETSSAEEKEEGQEKNTEAEENASGLQEEQAKEETEEKQRDWKKIGGYDNPIDNYFLPLLAGTDEEKRAEPLQQWRDAWKTELETYLEKYEKECQQSSDKELIASYRKALKGAIKQGNLLLESYEINEDIRTWFEIEMYRIAFIKHFRGEHSFQGSGEQKEEYQNGLVILEEMGEEEVYREVGRFSYPLDEEVTFGLDSRELSGADFRYFQDGFNVSWANHYDTLHASLLEAAGEKEKIQLEAYHKAMEEWAAAISNRFWWEPEVLNDSLGEPTLWGNGTRSGLNECSGWIYRLSSLQLMQILDEEVEMEIIFVE